jgi:hypothetical protein
MQKTKKLILVIAITILFVLFIAYAIESFYASPKYENYCEEFSFDKYDNQEMCESNSGKWYENGVGSGERAVPIKVGIDENSTGYCDVDFTCRQELDNDREIYNRNIFFISLTIGIITIIISALLAIEAVSAGFMAGGVLLVIYGTIRYWGELSDVLRTFMLGIALGVLVWVGYKKLK